jgi:hypothetical protein
LLSELRGFAYATLCVSQFFDANADTQGKSRIRESRSPRSAAVL